MFDFIKKMFYDNTGRKINKMKPMEIKTPKKNVPLDFTTFLAEEEATKKKGKE